MKETGSTSLDHLFLRADESPQLRLVFSAWNIGEVLGALDERHQKKHLTDDEFSSTVFNFSDETIRMARRGSTQILPVSGKLLTASWRLLLRVHVYEADALQIVSCQEEGCDIFVSADRRLLETAKNQGLTALDPAKDEKKLTSI